MADVDDGPTMNRLLAGLPCEELHRIAPTLEHVPLEIGRDIYKAGEPIDHAWFPGAGVVSLVIALRQGEPVEVATVGPEGMVGIPLLLGADQITSRALVQVPGSAMRMSRDAFHRALRENPGFERLLLRYALALINQVMQSVACNRMHSVEERLARWLLMTQDRVHMPEFPLTQEFIAQMLGVRRATVSLAAGMLMKAGLIHYVRARITVVDRPGLESAACECYQAIASEFERLVGTRG